jgi:hypothetical protein
VSFVCFFGKPAVLQSRNINCFGKIAIGRRRLRQAAALPTTMTRFPEQLQQLRLAGEAAAAAAAPWKFQEANFLILKDIQ